jgi:OOP family OmpA-OmpF porin
MLIKVPTHSESATIAPYDINKHKRSVHLFNPVSLQQKIEQQKLLPSAENLFILIDSSSQMNEDYRGLSRRDYAREILRRFNNTLPDIGLKGGVYVFAGEHWFANTGTSSSSTSAGKVTGKYDPERVERDLDEGEHDGHVGSGTLASAIDALADRIVVADGSSAFVLITRWEMIDTAAVDAIARLRQRSQHASGFEITDVMNTWQGKSSAGVCVYSIGVGNAYSRARFDQADRCGFSVASDKIAQPRDMAHFVERALFSGPADMDGDGIYDYMDKCPNTEKGRLVRFDGCYRFGAMQEMVLEDNKTRAKSVAQ